MWACTIVGRTRAPKSFLSNIYSRLTAESSRSPTTTLATGTATRSLFSTANAGKLEYAWNQWDRLRTFLRTGQVCVIDGANGTEIQRRGGKPAETFSSGTAAMTRPDLCQEVHLSYLNCGADILIIHSYSTNRNVMTPSGNGERVAECILSATAIARRSASSHSSHYASTVCSEAALHNQVAYQAVSYASTAAARATTSLGTNESSQIALDAAVKACEQAAEASKLSLHAAKDALGAATGANLAAQAASAASEGVTYEPVMLSAETPKPLPVEGWDAAAFGPTMVVGSLSTHPPEMPAGGMSSAAAKWPPPEEEEEAYEEAATALANSGVDLLFLEMMKDRDHAPRACRAAAKSGLPVFLGISARTCKETGKPILFGTGEDANYLTKDWFQSLKDILGSNLVGVNVMHTNFSAMAPTLKFLREDCGWTGALGAYPDHGVFAAPEWVFYELDNQEAIEYIEGWVKTYNVQLVGGCCGLGPEYINAVSAFTRRHNAAVREQANETKDKKSVPQYWL